MKAIIKLNIPEFQIGQEVKIYFSDTMMIKGMTEKQKIGHWIDRGSAWDECLECSICGCELNGVQTDILKAYCPSCGAKMEGDR